MYVLVYFNNNSPTRDVNSSIPIAFNDDVAMNCTLCLAANLLAYICLISNWLGSFCKSALHDAIYNFKKCLLHLIFVVFWWIFFVVF